MDYSPAGASPSPERSAQTELTWRGRAVTDHQAAAVYFLGSLAILILGVWLNHALTDGAWESEARVVQSPFGTGPTYLTSSTYDVLTLLILVFALVLLGAGYVATYQPSLLRPGPLVLAVLTAGTGAAWASDRYAVADLGDGTLLGTLATIFALTLLAAVIGSRLGAGRAMHGVRAGGFVLFGLYWATQAMRLYVAEEGDFVNAAFAGLAVFFFNYFAYQELLSARRLEDPRALHWLAGAAFLTTGVYVATHKLQAVSEWLILRVSEQTTWLLQFFGNDVVRNGGTPEGSMIYFPVDPAYPTGSGFFPIQIILACTAIQSIMIFVGGIFALRPPVRGDGVSGRPAHYERLRPTYGTRRFFALLLTVPLIYALNLLRNVIIIAMSGPEHPAFFSSNGGATGFVCRFVAEPTCGPADAAFWFSHNIIGKGGSLLALIVIAFMVFQVLPELYDSIVGLLDLKDRRGPLERYLKIGQGRRGNGGLRTRARAATATTASAGPSGEPVPSGEAP